MKKLILALLIGGLMMTGISAKTAVVYFSATGTTERMAKSAANAVGADIETFMQEKIAAIVTHTAFYAGWPKALAGRTRRSHNILWANHS